jgi:hypothetical protein
MKRVVELHHCRMSLSLNVLKWHRCENSHNFLCERAVKLKMIKHTLIVHEACASYANPVLICVYRRNFCGM